tara:strand:- start:2796 stop:3527 length:732 start_codon:yes stop_codon:yes gene_type:complete
MLPDISVKPPPNSEPPKEKLDVDTIFNKTEKTEEKVEKPQKNIQMEIQELNDGTKVEFPKTDNDDTIEKQIVKKKEKKPKKECSKKLYDHLSNARAKSLATRRLKAQKKKEEEEEVRQLLEEKRNIKATKINNDELKPHTINNAIDYDRIINGVVSKMDLNNQIDNDALGILEQDIRRDEQARQSVRYNDLLEKYEQQQFSNNRVSYAKNLLANRKTHPHAGKTYRNLQGTASSNNPFNVAFR